MQITETPSLPRGTRLEEADMVHTLLHTLTRLAKRSMVLRCAIHSLSVRMALADPDSIAWLVSCLALNIAGNVHE